MIRAGVVAGLAPALFDLGDMRRLGAQIGLGNAHVELGEVELFELTGAALAG